MNPFLKWKLSKDGFSMKLIEKRFTSILINFIFSVIPRIEAQKEIIFKVLKLSKLTRNNSLTNIYLCWKFTWAIPANK